MLYIKLAWRNIWRNWRRSVLTILAIFFATLLAVSTRSIQMGTYEANIKTALEILTGYIQIQKKGYQDNPAINKSFRFNDKLKSFIESDSSVKGYAKRIYGNGLISYRQNTYGILLFGISPEEEAKTSTLLKRIKKGSFISKEKQDGIVVGKKLLDNLNAGINDTIVVLTSGADGTMGNKKFQIIGTFSLGSPELDGMSAFINIEAADELMSMNGKINVVALRLDKINSIPDVLSKFKEANRDTSIAALGWEEVLPELKQSIEFDNASNVIFLLLLIIVVAFGILNTMLMSITERYREFGIMLALGTKHTKLLIIVFLEVIFLIMIGILLGNVIAHAINYYYYLHPIYLSGDFAGIYEQYGFIPAIYFSIDIGFYIDMSVKIILISLASFIYPAYKLYHFEALKGIRYT